MDNALILVRQIAQMFLLAGLGFCLFKSGKITEAGSKTLGNILIYLALPAVIINGFRVERTPEHMLGLLYSGVGAAVILLLSILVSRYLFRQDPIAAFFTQLQLPEVLSGCLTTAAGVNTPLAMFTVGVYLARVSPAKMLRRKSLYAISLARLILIPLISLALLSLLPAEMRDMKTALLIASACPVGVNVAVYAQLHNKDYAYAVETVILSTLFSIVTIPALVALTGLIW